MIVFEKIRAICQQMPEYTESIGRSYRTARARDFFDIHTVMNNFPLDLTSQDNIRLLKRIFKQKEVDSSLMNKIAEHREFHRQDYFAVKDAVKPDFELKDFDFYFDYVVEKCNELSHTLRII